MKLINKVLTGMALTAMTATAAQASTLEDVRAAGELKCCNDWLGWFCCT